MVRQRRLEMPTIPAWGARLPGIRRSAEPPYHAEKRQDLGNFAPRFQRSPRTAGYARKGASPRPAGHGGAGCKLLGRYSDKYHGLGYQTPDEVYYEGQEPITLVARATAKSGGQEFEQIALIPPCA
jgi:hypothetical protein